MQTRVIKLGLRHVLEGSDHVEEQIRLAHRYYNSLIEVEREKRKRIGAIQREADPEGLAQLVDDAKDSYEKALKLWRKEKSDLSKSIRDSARKELKEARAAWKERRAEINASERIKERFAEVEEWASGEKRLRRKTSGVYWGTYLLVEAAAEAAAKSKAPPRFQRWRHGAGRLGVQFQGGISMKDARSGNDRRIFIAGVKHHRDRPASRRYNPERGIGQGDLFVRVDSSKGEPVWARWETIIHQPLPPEAIIKWAVVVRRVIPGRSGPGRFRDELHLTVDAPIVPDLKMLPEAERSTVAIDIGWRRLQDDSLRVAAWMAGGGEWGLLTLERRELERSLDHAERLRAIRDTEQDRMRASLVMWADKNGWPRWWHENLRRRLPRLHLWRSSYAWRAFFEYWSKNRFEGDAQGYEILRQWWAGDLPLTAQGKHGDRHLWEYESNTRAKAIRRRDDKFKVWAAYICRRAKRIIIEDFDLRKLSRKKEGEQPGQESNARANRVTVAPGRFRDYLLKAARRRGVEVIAVPAGNTTKLCSWCGAINDFDAAKTIIHVCEGCQREWDQDLNAAGNILARERSDGAKVVVPARGAEESGGYAKSKGGRWQRRKAGKQDRSKQGAQSVAKR